MKIGCKFQTVNYSYKNYIVNYIVLNNLMPLF